MNVTIKDIAQIANVSHTTVSRALNDNTSIKQETRKRIQAIARRMNYVPNYYARSLVLDKSYNIGLLFSTLDRGTSPDFFYNTVQGVIQTVGEKYNVIIKGVDTYNDLNSFNHKIFDGIVIMSQSVEDNAFIYKATEKNVPLVVLNRQIDDSQIPNIVSDDYTGAQAAVNYLISLGHCRIALIEGKEEFKASEKRKQGYLDALINRNIPLRKEYMIKGYYDIESGYLAMKQLLGLPNYPTAVFCSNDDMAMGSMKAIIEKGLQIPKDISVIGFDNNVASEFLSPALTTVKRDMTKMSSEGTKMLLKLIDKKTIEQNYLLLDTSLVIRNSTCICIETEL